MKIRMAVWAVMLMLGLAGARAELGGDWRMATAEEKGMVPQGMTNLLYAFNAKRSLVAMAGSSPLQDPITTKEERDKFLKDVLAGMATSGMVLKEQKDVTVNGQVVTECVFEIPQAGKYTIFALCPMKDKFINLAVVATGPITWDDPDAVMLLKEMPIK